MIFRIIISISLMTIIIASCGEKIDRPAPVLSAEQIAKNQSTFESPTIPSGAVVGGVKHYLCPNGHEGSDAQGTCISCGAELTHNQAFHDQPAAATGDAPGAEPPQNAIGVWHYTCPNGHDGGSGSATACTVCGTTLVHNTVYHDSDVAATPTTPGAIPPPAPTASPEPPQNAAGVWHYTCPSGHEGGSGSATACAECGATLVHNTVYHE